MYVCVCLELNYSPADNSLQIDLDEEKKSQKYIIDLGLYEYHLYKK